MFDNQPHTSVKVSKKHKPSPPPNDAEAEDTPVVEVDPT